VGAATALSFSLRLQELILGVYVVSIGTVLLPMLAGRAASGDWASYNAGLRSSLDAVSLVTIPVTALCLIMGKDIVTLLFRIKEFDEQSAALTAGAFFFHSLGLFFIGLNRILAPAFYARKDTRSPAAAGIASFAVNIGLALALTKPLGGRGIALAVSAAAFANTCILVWILMRRRETDRRLMAGAGLYALKILGFTAIAALPAYFMAPPLRAWASGFGNAFLSRSLPLLVVSLVFAAIGLGLLALTRDPVLASLAHRLARRAKKS
jgi:putative peptidoglycan lipid II flippase